MEIYDLQTLIQVLRVQPKSVNQFFRTNWFGRTMTFDNDTIMFDKVFGDDRFIAPFVAPNVNGRPSRLLGYETVSFKPAYVKMEDTVDPTVPFERLAGEAISVGSLTAQQRYDASKAELMRQQRVKLDNLHEVMAAKALIDARITIKGESYPEVEVDFRRDASLTQVLTGAALWSAAGTATPLADLKLMRVRANNLSGARITKHIFGGDAWEAFASRVDLKELMRREYAGAGQNTRMTLITEGYEGIEYMGTIEGMDGQGRIEAWVHTGKYREFETGAEQFVLDQKSVVGISDMVEGVQCYGAIKHRLAEWKAMPMFPHNWVSQDGSAEYMTLQSAPLLLPKQPNATFKIKVLA